MEQIKSAFMALKEELNVRSGELQVLKFQLDKEKLEAQGMLNV